MYVHIYSAMISSTNTIAECTPWQVESEDDLPVAFDVHEIVDMDVTERRSHLTTVLKDCPSDGKEAFIEKYVERINELNPHL